MTRIPNLTIRELGYLVALADYGHFGKAAEACCIGQPTLSTQLRKLEERLGVTLFERTNKRLRITPLGQKIVAKARQIIAEAESIIDLGHRHDDPLSGELTLGIIPTLSTYMLSWLIPALRETVPKLKLVVHEDLTAHLIEKLHSHEVDAALVALPVSADELKSIPLFVEPFWFVCSTTHPLTKRKSVTSKALSREQLLLLTEGHCLRDQALELCGRANTVAEQGPLDFRATSLETLRQMVAHGMGSTLMPAMAIVGRDNANSQVASRPLADGASRRIGLVFRSSYPVREDLEYFAKITRDNLPETVVKAN